MNLSVILPSYGNDLTLKDSLRSVLEQRCAEDWIEVIVVHSGGRIEDSIKSQFPSVLFVESEVRLYAGAARNRGAAIAKGDWLVFLDSDCMWNHSWLQAAKEIIPQFPDALGFNGRVYFEDPKAGWAYDLHLFEFHEFLSSKPGHQRFVHSGNLLIRKSFFSAMAGFREDIPMCTDFTFAAQLDENQLKKFYYIPRLAITHLAHFIEPKAIQSKIEKMGYWRGYVEAQIPSHLQLHKKFWFFFGRFFLGSLFFISIGWRMVKLRSCSILEFAIHAPRIFQFCHFWAKGFKTGYAETALAPPDLRPRPTNPR